MNKQQRKLLKKKYLEENPDPIQQEKMKYSKMTSLSEHEFSELDDIDLEMHIINFINFNLLESKTNNDISIEKLQPHFLYFYLVYYYRAYALQDGIAGLMSTELINYLQLTIVALKKIGSIEHYNFWLSFQNIFMPVPTFRLGNHNKDQT